MESPPPGVDDVNDDASSLTAAREGLMVDERNVLVLKDVRFGGGDDEGVGRNRRRIRIRLLERKSPKIVDAFKEFGRNGVFLGTFTGQKLFRRCWRDR